MGDGRQSFIARLKQHHVFRVASWYATAAYVLILVANAVFPDIGLSRDDVRYVIAGLALGFPVVLTLSWMLIPPTKEDPKTFNRWKKLRWRLGAVFSLLVIVFVTLSGIYLWRLNARHMGDYASDTQAGTQSIVVLPFDKSGTVDDALVRGTQEAIEDTLSNLGSVHVISHAGISSMDGPKSSLRDSVEASGAAFAIQGSIERKEGKSPYYTVHMELISIPGMEPLIDVTPWFLVQTQTRDIEKATASIIAGPVQFQTGGTAWLASGFPTTKNPRALELLRRAIMTRRYGGSADPFDLIRAALKLDPDFPQAHAYLALLEAWNHWWDFDPAQPGYGDIDNEIVQAEKLAPGLPEAQLARAARSFMIDGDDAAAEKTLECIETPLASNTDMHWLRGFVYRSLGRWEDSLHEFQKTTELDPYFFNPIANVGVLQFSLRQYEAAEEYLSSMQERWPTSPKLPFWRAQIAFSYHGDVDALAAFMDRFPAENGLDPSTPWFEDQRLEVEHLQGKHADVIKRLQAYPRECFDNPGYGNITRRLRCADIFTAESLRLLGLDQEATRSARLHIPQVAQEAAAPDGTATLRLALLQIFAGDSDAALKTIAPLLKQLAKPADRWDESDGFISSDVAVVLAWSGQRQQAIEILKQSLDATYGAHAAILARDPVWRPLYKEPAFVALLAAHGQKLAYAH